MPAVDPVKLKRLLTLEVLLPFALERRLSAAQLEDLTQRATADKRFALSAVSDEFAGYMNPGEASNWAVELEASGKAAHVFAVLAQDASKSEATFGNLPLSEVEKMSPEARLQLANQVADEQRNAASR